MKGSEQQLLDFMEGKNNRYVIPVYQRKYDWKIDNCRQLYSDLKRVVRDYRNSHFFGSIVSQVLPEGARVHYHIIDGQQRLTTVTLLLLAMSHLLDKELVKSEEDDLSGDITESYIISKRAKEDDRIKLRPGKRDRSAFAKLVKGDPEDFEPASNLTINYRFFYDQILKEEISVDDLYAAINKLQIINITLEDDDNAQLIFESLNSTGRALKEGDKIRNYVLMSLSPIEQERYYENYWEKIEECTQDDVSTFVRDYLSVKQLVTPTISNVYEAFKDYVEKNDIALDDLLEDMKLYARIYEKLLTGKSGLGSVKLDDCLYRLNRLEIVVTRPFFMEVLRLNQDGAISADDVARIFQITENYLFRRNICDVPTNALNKVFLNLNREVCRYDGTTDNYVQKFIYALLSKKESSRFPDDDEFKLALSEKAVYNMRGKYKAYLFERFENFGTEEVKDVYKLLDNGTYSIEHIMPQHLTPAWKQDLGVDADEIHATWLNRLGNLTLTAYNSNMSNSAFTEKRDADKGYKKSGLRMNQRIAIKDHWGLAEMQERSRLMVDQATTEIWPMPVTIFTPAEKEYDSCSLDDEDFELKGREIIKYSYQGTEIPVSSWMDMFEHVIKYLHTEDKSVLSTLAYSSSDTTDLGSYFSNDEKKLRSPLKIDENIYAEKNTGTVLKVSILRRLFKQYHADPSDLVFYLRDADSKVGEDSQNARKRYWEYALPIIQAANAHRGTFGKRNPTASTYMQGYFGIGSFYLACVANNDLAKLDFCMTKDDQEKNKEAFDRLYAYKSEIEKKLGVSLTWNRNDNDRSSDISYETDRYSLSDENSWPQMAQFHSEWSDKMLNVILPYLQDLYPDVKVG